MILHRENTVRTEPFYKSLSNLSLYQDGEIQDNYSSNELKQLEKYSYFIQNLMTFEQEIKNDINKKILLTRFHRYLKGIIPVKGISLMFYDEFKKELVPIDEEENNKIAVDMNHFNRSGIFKAMFNDKRITVVPDLEHYNENGAKLFYLIFPIYDDKSNYGIFSILTSLNDKNISELEKKSINIFLNLVLGRLEKIRLTEKLNSTYEELQTYQAKLSNDFRLSAIGEMTEGIVEDIVNPLQVISSNVDILQNDLTTRTETIQIKSQINRIKNVIGRLVKFADVNQKDVKIKPCNINNIVNEYFHLVKSTLDNANLEFILDFEKELPPILSHPNYIYQLLTNIFTLVKNNKTQRGGIVIQTRYKDDQVILRLITTSKIYKPEKEKGEVQYNLSIKIIKNLMKKHEGKLEIGNIENSGSSLILKFPLKRKIRR
ncbi:MAG: hypothetical protein CR986_01435 [Ignavibacteriae bacterium]|nr:MAG: hypothetical protein CR986_01435 [Ignavibacteriota bacterium]